MTFSVPLSALESFALGCIQSSGDVAHDALHLRRVVSTAMTLAKHEQAREDIVLTAAWLHDCEPIAKNDVRRGQASRLSAQKAKQFLKNFALNADDLTAITHAIEAHSFSAGIAPLTLEAKIVQDADRLDALGAIGLARMFATAGLMNRTLYESSDPFCATRPANDELFTLDHFYKKLVGLVETLNTASAQTEGTGRIKFMKDFLNQLSSELNIVNSLTAHR